MTALIAFISAHAQDIVTAFTYLVAAASLLANLTTNQTDNKIVAVLSKVVNFLALNFKK